MHNLEILEELKKKNSEVVSGQDPWKKKREDLVREGQKPYATVVCCSDSRVVPELIFGVDFGSLFVIRTAGNVILDAEMASLEYAIEHLHTGVVLIMGHTHCGAIEAAMHQESGGYIHKIVDDIHDAISGEEDELDASWKNAIYQAGKVKAAFPNAFLVPCVYDTLTGKVLFER